jgi:hypothetical protein
VAHWAEPVTVAGTTFSSAINTLRDDNAHELHVLASQTVAECYAPGWLPDSALPILTPMSRCRYTTRPSSWNSWPTGTTGWVG